MSTYRYHSRLIAVVHSWQSSEPIDLSADLVAVSTSKGVKAVGQFSLVVVPRLNWFNYIYQNDVVNIYYDPGDGVSGWTRVMMGYVDRVFRNEAVVDESGRTSTTFTISGRDFMKAVDGTEIVFRPELAQRPDWKLEERFFFNNIGGMGMMFRGVVGHGPPDVIVGGIMAGMMGYGAQWQLPPSYAGALKNPVIAGSRNRRTQEAYRRLSANTLSALQTLGFGDLVGTGVQDAAVLSNKLRALWRLVDRGGESKSAKKALKVIEGDTLAIQSYVNAVIGQSENKNGGIYDLLDPSFVEGKCIDGYADAAAVWQAEGALSNIVYKWCNPAINELIFDLRPVATGENSMSGDNLPEWRGYSRDGDELGINVSGYGVQSATVPGVKYVPTMIMREYPFSVAPGLDMRGFLSLGMFPADIQAFGPVFSSPTTSSDPISRVLYDYNSLGVPELSNGITSAPELYDESAPAVKHLDVATVKLNEMTRMSVSRGDGDTFNLFVIYQTLYPSATRYNLPDYLPIFNLASIARDGVRLREISTNYAGWTNRTRPEYQQAAGAFLLMRWATLLEHWYQHNAEYLSGTITMRPRADIRVGYRLDIPERAESYYVTDVAHSWEKDAEGRVRGATTLQVTRGQRTDPFPIYIPPSMGKKTVPAKGEKTTEQEQSRINEDAQVANSVAAAISGNRGTSGRLAKFFFVRSATATERAGIDKQDTINATDATPAKGTGPYIPGSPEADIEPVIK